MFLTAQYTTTNPPFEPFTSQTEIQSPSSTSVQDTQAYLSRLRGAVTQTQDEINKKLTAFMEQEKEQAAAASAPDAVQGSKRKANSQSGGGGKKNVDEVDEELNYGEEVVEED